MVKFRVVILYFFFSWTLNCYSGESGGCRSADNVNDDYCDCFDGSDELTTSACSHKRFGAKFLCKGSGFLNTSIPTSRVRDGVCDCCDGSDEEESVATFPNIQQCTNSCDAILFDERRQALSVYRTVRDGARLRRNLAEELRQEKSMAGQSLESLQKEKSALENVWMEMKYILSKEETKENKERFKLLREREARCAKGVISACDYFHAEWLPDDEIAFEGFEGNHARPRKQLRAKPLAEEISTFARLSGIAKVRASLCHTECVIPDGTSRIFPSVGSLLDFTNSSGAVVSRTPTLVDVRKSTLFHSILEKGSQGRLDAMLSLLEFLALLWSPLLLLLLLLSYCTRYVWSKLWESVSYCAYHIADDSKHGLITRQVRLALSKGCEVVVRAVSSDLFEHPVAVRVLNAIDITSYSGVMHFIDFVHPLTSTISFVGRVLWRAPALYYGFYLSSPSLRSQLPPLRNACLLREGLAVAKMEIVSVNKRLQKLLEDIAQQQSIENKEQEISDSVSSPSASFDFGLDGVWEALKNKCIEKRVGEYNYSLCFFDKISQGRLRLGKYVGWGNYSLLQPRIESGRSEGRGRVKKGKESYASPQSTRPGRSSKWNFGFGFNSEIDDDKNNLMRFLRKEMPDEYFKSQMYIKGDSCDLGGRRDVTRQAQVDFSCAETTAIIDVIEQEKCFYLLTVSTPLACTDTVEERALRRLEDLQVFGFTSPRHPQQQQLSTNNNNNNNNINNEEGNRGEPTATTTPVSIEGDARP